MSHVSVTLYLPFPLLHLGNTNVPCHLLSQFLLSLTAQLNFRIFHDTLLILEVVGHQTFMDCGPVITVYRTPSHLNEQDIKKDMILCHGHI